MPKETRITGEDAMLNVLKDRYHKGNYYIWAADILVALRPPDAFEKNLNPDQLLDVLKAEDFKNCQPQSFAKAIYNALLSETDEELCDQAVVLRGISGSGKTEMCKDFLNSLVLLGSPNQHLNGKINQVFTVLEAFGNSRTPCNKNSSRFSSTFTTYFREGKAVGLSISRFLFDPWRVTERSDEGSTFHAFYYAVADCHDNQAKTSYRLLKDLSGLNRQVLDRYREKRRALTEAMKALGFSTQEQSDAMLVLKTILMLGNVSFKRSKFGDIMLDEESKEIIRTCAETMGLDEEEFCDCLCFKKTCVSKEEVVKSYTRDEAEDFVDFLLWTIYDRLFSWLVASIGDRFSPDEGATEGSENKLRRVHVVDFPGREVFQTNSTEQFMINVSDDVLHYSFVENYSVLEEDDYLGDGLEWVPRTLPGNSGLINLFLLHGGVFDSISKGLGEDKTPPTSASLLFPNQSKQDKKYFHFDSKTPNTFLFTHYDNENVDYDIRGWSQRNKSRLPGNVIMLLKNSENPLLSLLMRAKFNHRGSRRPPITPETALPLAKERCFTPMVQFKSTLIDYLRLFTDTTTSYICCIRPFSSSSSGYNPQLVQKQFEGMGLKDVAYNFKIIHQTMFTFQEFVKKYYSLSSSSSSSPKDICLSILNTQLPDDSWKMGTSKIFLKQQQLAYLNNAVRQKNRSLQESRENPVSAEQRQDNKFEGLYSQVIRPSGNKPPNDPSSNYAEVCRGGGSEVKTLDEQTYGWLNVKKSTKSMRLYPLLDMPPTSAQKPAVPIVYVSPFKPHLQKVESDSDSDFETLPSRREGKKFGEVGAKMASIKWFKTTQAKQLLQDNGFYADWFHGIISRRNAEALLKDKPKGCFLIRLAESRLGYSLSFRGNEKCRHYMVDEVDGGNFRVVGERAIHSCLLDLVEFYKKHKISNWNGYLTVPCEQTDGECDYADLLLTSKDIQELRQAMNRPRVEPSAPSHSSRKMAVHKK